MINLTLLKIVTYLSHPYTLIFFVFGCILGSFFNVCILRIPEGTFWKTLRSSCPKCLEPIPWWLNIPILSWLFLRGKARCCGAKISSQYPLVEFFTGVGFAVLYWQFPFLINIDGDVFIDYADLTRLIHALVFFSVLLICSVIDLRLMIIPDVLSLGMIVFSPVWVFFHPELDWQSSLYGVLAGGGVLYAVAWLYWILRKQAGMGMGDVKLLAGMGGWLGYQSIFPTIFYASITGSLAGLIILLISKKSDLKFEIPFGPFLAFGGMLYLLYGSSVIDFVLGRG